MKTRKNIYLMVLMIIGMMLIAGCNSNTEGESETASQETGEETYKIGISQLVEHPALDDARKGFEDGLKELGVNAEVDYQNAQGDIPNTMSIAEKFVNDEMDLILAIATPAAQSAKQVTSDIPILFTAVTDPVESEIVEDWENVAGNVTGTSDEAPIDSQLAMFKEIDPSIEKVGILYNTSESNSEVQIEAVKELAPHHGLELEIMGVNNVNEISQSIASLTNNVDALYMITDNLIASAVELTSRAAIDNDMITISGEETQVRGGLLVTNGLSYYELGKQTAEMAKEVLVDGKDISSIPVGRAENTITTYNQQTFDALGLDENMEIFKDATAVGQ